MSHPLSVKATLRGGVFDLAGLDGQVPGVSEILRMNETDLERELAALRHMEKVKEELRRGKRMIRPS